MGVATVAIGQALPLSHIQQENATLNQALPIYMAQSDYRNSEISVPLRADYFYKRGLAYTKKEFYSAAIPNFTEAIRLKPNFADAYYQRGIARFLEPPPAVDEHEKDDYPKDYDGAIKDLTEAIQLKPDFANAYYQRSKVLEERGEDGDSEKALEDLNQTIRFDPNHLKAYEDRVRTWGDNIQNRKQALADYNQIIRLKPKDALVYMQRAEIKFKLGDKQGALADENEAIQLNPKNALIYLYRASNREKREDYKGAIADYTQVLNLNPIDLDLADMYFERSQLRQRIKDFQGAAADLTQLRRLIEAHPEIFQNSLIKDVASAYIWEASAYLEAKNYRVALATYTEALKREPNNPSLYASRAEAFQ